MKTKILIAVLTILLVIGLALGTFLFLGQEVVAEGLVSSNPVVTMGWTATDPVPGSGVDGYSLEWSENGAVVPDMVKECEEDEETGSFTLTDGVWYCNVMASDYAGNWSDTATYGPVVIDTHAPTITITKQPELYDGENGWFKSPLFMECAANEGSTIYYSWDNVDFTVYEERVQAPEGTTTFYAYAVDVAGNQSVTNEVTLKVDTRKPLMPTITQQ